MGLLSSLFGSSKKSESEIKEETEKKNFDILKYDGMRARNIRQLPYAIKCFEEAIAIKEDAEVMKMLATSYLQTGKTEEALKTYNRIMEIEPENIDILLSAASICFMEENYTAMNELCHKAINIDENNRSALYLSAKAERGLKNHIQSLVMLTKAIKADEDFKEAYLLRAEVLWDMRQAKEALEDLETVLSKEEDNEEAILLKGEIMAVTGNDNETVSCMDKVLSINPFNEKAYIIKAAISIQAKEFDKALDIYNEALDLIPENAKIYQERGRVKLLKGDKDGSMADLKKAIELDPESENKISGNYNNFSEENRTGIY